MQHTVESPCPLSAPPPLITLTPSLPHLTLGIPRSRCSTPALPPTSSLACTLYWHHVPLPPRVNLHTGTPFLCLPLHPSCLHPLPPPRLHCHGPVPASSSPLTSTWGFHVADAAHRGVTMPSVCPTPFNISNAYPLPAPSSPRSRRSTPSCPLLTLGIPHAGAARRGVPMCSALPPTHHHAFCPPHTSFVSLPGVGGTGRQPLNMTQKCKNYLDSAHLNANNPHVARW